ncbi:MAG: hypothetical protein ILA52_02070 [Alphaproteobacteria bacterium]|nr:hypothetical protein [Alphaproteobacteria bacterium]MBP1532270.1 hypothetical protein [Alphaproteobacteria bacterium]
MLNLTKQGLSADSEVLSLNSNSVFADNMKRSYLRDSASISANSYQAAEILGLKSKDDYKGVSKDDSQKAQSGRSMIEMLGVLAIIGVLSVGGIAGYSKAMMQYKINKTTDQISQIVGNMRTLFSSQKQYGVAESPCYTANDCIYLKKAHIIPDEMWGSDGVTVENAFGGKVFLQATTKKLGERDLKGFSIQLQDLPEEACMSLSTYDWGSSSSSGLVALAINNGSGGFASSDGYSQGYKSDGMVVAVPNGNTVSIPVPVSEAATACQESDTNYLSLNFY